MRSIILTYFILATLVSYSQNVKSIDTLKLIEVQLITDHSIKYISGDKEFRFSKSATLSVFSDLLINWKLELDTTENVKDWQREAYKEYLSVADFIASNKTLVLYDLSEMGVNNFKEIEDEMLRKTARYFQELACDLLDIGAFEYYKNGMLQEQVIKAVVYESDENYGMSSIKFILLDGEAIWTCPPITIDDSFDFEDIILLDDVIEDEDY